MNVLDTLNFTPATLLIAIERAAAARKTYLRQCKDAGIAVESSVEHALTNHILRLQDVANAANLGDDAIMDALRRGLA